MGCNEIQISEPAVLEIIGIAESTRLYSTPTHLRCAIVIISHHVDTTPAQTTRCLLYTNIENAVHEYNIGTGAYSALKLLGVSFSNAFYTQHSHKLYVLNEDNTATEVSWHICTVFFPSSSSPDNHGKDWDTSTTERDQRRCCWRQDRDPPPLQSCVYEHHHPRDPRCVSGEQ